MQSLSEKHLPRGFEHSNDSITFSSLQLEDQYVYIKQERQLIQKCLAATTVHSLKSKVVAC